MKETRVLLMTVVFVCSQQTCLSRHRTAIMQKIQKKMKPFPFVIVAGGSHVFLKFLFFLSERSRKLQNNKFTPAMFTFLFVRLNVFWTRQRTLEQKVCGLTNTLHFYAFHEAGWSTQAFQYVPSHAFVGFNVRNTQNIILVFA